MDRSMKVFVVVFMLLVATGFQGVVQVALARECTSPSHKFKGLCVSDTNCASVCLTERFPGGKCDGIRQRCLCTEKC
ncbi:hypothetical protein CFC21_096839 [Triticum aestivum]|uniref:Knottins-like domain-containing protein n=2 Tax=Triticum aestivum TaxID=4565 RepID=A0A9R1LT83_WHEAT|nr:hypothetical protein CFC21_096838 [Triticum aestivum]KAF7094538.1 hypothetical protein CFC21_096839 [Triticum aestivum]